MSKSRDAHSKKITPTLNKSDITLLTQLLN